MAKPPIERMRVLKSKTEFYGEKLSKLEDQKARIQMKMDKVKQMRNESGSKLARLGLKHGIDTDKDIVFW
jgi:hypothetical protein